MNPQQSMTNSPRDRAALRTQHANRIGGPFSLILNPAGDIPVMAGATFELSLTLSNQGDRSALINLYIAETSTAVRQWCLVPEAQLALSQGQSSEVIFQFEVPIDVVPGTYEFVLVIDAPDHYPEDTPILHQSRVQVSPFVSEGRTSSDPSFSLQPKTNSTQPAQLPAGEPLEVTVFVRNRSDRVDRFRLLCPDLEASWYKVIYPEGFSDLGAVVPGENLELNPGDLGQISLLITPPLDTPAGVYVPTISLKSANSPELAMLDTLYLQVLPIYLLEVELLATVAKIRDRAGRFSLQLRNSGNTPREIIVRAREIEEKSLCIYTVLPERVYLLPGASAIVDLEIEPKQRWKRPFYGRLIEFVVELEDAQQLPLVNPRFQSVLNWEGRPWWHFLLVVLSILGLIGAIVFLIWWFFPRPPVPPEIVEFAPQNTNYQEVNGDAVRLNWQISSPDRLQTLKIEAVSPEGVIVSRPVTYDFSRGIPRVLKPFCRIEIALTCRNVPTDARRAGDYIFQLTVTQTPTQNRRGKPQGTAPIVLKTSTIRMAPIPLPQVMELVSTSPLYRQVPPETAAAEPTSNPTPTPTPSNLPATPAKQPSRLGSEGILLNWTVTHPSQIKALQLVGRDPEGIINTAVRRFDFSQGLPAELRGLCLLTLEELKCKNVPTGAIAPGIYRFELTAIPQQATATAAEPLKTEPITIEGLTIPAKIVEFKINGVQGLPKYFIQLDPSQQMILAIAWQVEGEPDTQVELLPAPGTVPLTGKIPYPLSPNPENFVLTLQVTAKDGKQLIRSVEIETFLVQPEPGENGEMTIPALPQAPGQPTPPPVPQAPQAPQTPAEPTTPPPPPLPPGASPPIPPGRNSPPPSELPPQLY